MYLKMSEITLVLDTRKRNAGDLPVYRLRHGAEDVLTPDPATQQTRGAVRYGTLYYDSNDRPCVVPDDVARAERDDFHLARRVIGAVAGLPS